MDVLGCNIQVPQDRTPNRQVWATANRSRSERGITTQNEGPKTAAQKGSTGHRTAQPSLTSCAESLGYPGSGPRRLNFKMRALCWHNFLKQTNNQRSFMDRSAHMSERLRKEQICIRWTNWFTLNSPGRGSWLFSDPSPKTPSDISSAVTTLNLSPTRHVLGRDLNFKHVTHLV